MGKFLNDLDIDVIKCQTKKKNLFELITPFAYVSDFLKREKGSIEFIVPIGFTSESSTKSGIIRDYLYSSKPISRWGCDHVYLEAMHDEGVSYLKRQLLFFKARLFGQASWELDW